MPNSSYLMRLITKALKCRVCRVECRPMVKLCKTVW